MPLKTFVLIVSTALLLVACGKEAEPPKPKQAELFDRVPAVTPYVFGNREPYPRDAYLRQLQLAQDMLPVYRDMLREAAGTAGEASKPLTPEQREARDTTLKLLGALIDEFDGKLTPEGMESLGFRLDMHWVIYGNGLAPVIRYELGDGSKVLALLKRIEQRAGVDLDWRNYGDAEYLQLGDDTAQLVFGVRPKQAVLALLPGAAVDSLLPQLLGDEAVAEPLTAAGLVTRLDGYALPGYGDGYVDHGRLYRLLIEPSAGAAIGVDGFAGQPLPMPMACRGLVEQLLDRMPRTVIGTSEVSADRLRIRMVFETSAAIAETLQGLSVAVPGVGRDSDAMYTFGAAMQLSRLRIALKDAIRFIANQGDGCEWSNREALLATLPQLDAALSPFTAMFKGVYVEAIDMENNPDTGRPTDVRFRGLVQLDDPRGLFAMLGMFVPDLAQLDVPQDGTPVQVPMDSLPPGTPQLFVAANEQVLGVAGGSDGADLARQLLGEQPSPDRPLLSFSYNFKRLSRFMESGIDDLLAQAKPQAGGVDAEQAKAEFERMAAIFRNYGTISFRVLATARGLTVEEALSWE